LLNCPKGPKYSPSLTIRAKDIYQLKDCFNQGILKLHHKKRLVDTGLFL